MTNSELHNIIKQISDLEVQFKEKSTKMLGEFLISLIPDGVQAYRFHAYTPYFNDGEECTYRVSKDYPEFLLKKTNKKLAEGHRVSIPAFDATGVVDSIDKKNVIVRLANKKLVTLKLSEVTSLENRSDDFEEHYDERDELGLYKVSEGLEQISDDVYKTVFGDHVEITVTREKVSTKPYDHD